MVPDQSLELIRQKFLLKLAGLLDEFESWAKRLEHAAPDPEPLKGLRISIHQIAGSARTFGFPETSKLAAEAEDFIVILLGEKEAADQATEEIAAKAANALRSLITHSAELIETEQKTVPVEAPAPHKMESDQEKFKVLICDDDVLMGDLIRQAFSSEGCQVIDVADGKDTLEQVRCHQPDLIIQDVNMPEISGFEVLEQLKSESDTAHIPVVMLTRRTEDRSIIKGISGGAVDYIFKPFTVEELVNRVMGILHRAKTTILLVDDDSLVRELVALRLRKLGWAVVEASNGRSALEAFVDKKPDLVVLDLMMPGIGGMSVLNRIKEGSGKDTPVVIISANAQTENVVAGLEAGAHDYLTKPFNLDELVARVAAILKRKKL